jgi:peptidoglycan/xylan/chitin deacetylase (PgdA/CDA1 family)
LDKLANIPILTYHKISDQAELGLTTVSPENFERQMQALKDLNFVPITFTDLDRPNELPPKAIIITFDDGYESVYTNALPILKKYGFRAVVYIITDYIGKKNTWESVSFQQKFRHLSLAQIKILQNNGMEIASHGKTHRYLSMLDSDEVICEIEESKQYLEKQIGQRIISFCYPYGRSTQRIAKIVEKAGYKYAAQNLSLIPQSDNQHFTLKRRSVYASDNMQSFYSKLEKPAKFNYTFVSESIIQKGALASIAIKYFVDAWKILTARQRHNKR